MRAVWYDRQGPAADVLQVGDLPDPDPDPATYACDSGSPGSTRATPRSDAAGSVRRCRTHG